MPGPSLLTQRKMSIPSLPFTYLKRLPQLGGALRDRRLIVIQAPPGYGKTSLARELLDHEGPAVWYSLDSRDRDPVVFLDGLLSAITGGRAEVPAVSQNLTEAIDLLRGVLDRLDEPFRLVLDNAHQLARSDRTTEILEILAFPRRVPARLVCATRHPLVLPRSLRGADGETHHLTERELALSPAQAVALFAGYGHLLDEESAVKLVQSFEGWPAALDYLARTAGGGDPVDSAPLSTELLTWLGSGLLDEPDEGMQGFLMRTAVLRRFNLALCRQLAGPDAARHLAAARANSPFVLTVDPHGCWFRYHRQLRRVLESRLRAEAGLEGLRRAHRAAAAAWRREGDHAEAIHHLIQAGDRTQAVGSVSETAPRMPEAGAIIQVGEWLSGLPTAQLRDDPVLTHVEGVVDMYSGHLAEARAIEVADALARAGQAGNAAQYAALAPESCAPENTLIAHRARSLLPVTRRDGSGRPYGRTSRSPSRTTSARGEPHDGHLRIQTLTEFVVVRAGAAMSPSDWGRRRAQQLFKLLLSAGRPLHGEEIIDLLWPEETSVETARRKLNTTVYWLRHALEPGLRRGPDSRYVAVREQLYSLQLQPGDRWDVQQLRAFAAGVPGSAEPGAILAAFEAACGEYLPSDRYETWADPVRNELIGIREKLLTCAIDEARQAGDVRGECAILERALEADPWREDLAERLMRLYTATGRRDSARRLHRRRSRPAS